MYNFIIEYLINNEIKKSHTLSNKEETAIKLLPCGSKIIAIYKNGISNMTFREYIDRKKELGIK